MMGRWRRWKGEGGGDVVWKFSLGGKLCGVEVEEET